MLVAFVCVLGPIVSVYRYLALSSSAPGLISFLRGFSSRVSLFQVQTHGLPISLPRMSFTSFLTGPQHSYLFMEPGRSSQNYCQILSFRSLLIVCVECLSWRMFVQASRRRVSSTVRLERSLYTHPLLFIRAFR
ncbi:hypothetical protein CPB84DRAFT_1790782 [Gymnopilus junonius]|uniref:Uncharacterized protein n=1 Tax=Gymnopilus junonius TaxID=109634 RepID=A0A9P5N955_GYMJU|nr:hypothetical protein CPB84DRAFT_1798576 [Gymnopilus junonius]KAF8882622.1 hypothetical protein CPB84DRAFT_1790782 [Gymnopilus junonius]